MSNNNEEATQQSTTTQSNVEPSATQSDHGPSTSSTPAKVTNQHAQTLTTCNNFVNQYRKGEILKASAYMAIQGAIFETDGISDENAQAGFKSLSQRLRTMTQKSQWHRGEEKNPEEENLEVSVEPPLLSRIHNMSMTTKQTGSRNLKWMSETFPGSKQESLGEPCYQPVYQKCLTSYDSSVLI
jgi:hypothetical protein